MAPVTRRDRAIACAMIAVAIAAFVTVVLFAFAAVARADTTPVGPLPGGPVSIVTTGPNQLVAVALPNARRQSGLVWRLARQYDAGIVRQISEADVGANVVVVFRVVGRGDTSLVFAQTRGEASGRAVKALTHKIRSR